MSLHLRSKFVVAGLALGGAALAAGLALAQAPVFFRIGTGGTAGTYYPIGGLIANAISSPPQLVSTAVASNGSVANVNAIVGGAAESGFVQADVAFWAYSGTGVFEGKPKVRQHQAVYATLGKLMGNEIHALQLTTYTPAQWADFQKELG